MTDQQQFLLDAKAAHASRVAYQRAAVRLREWADELRRDGWREGARLCDGFARAARNEYEGRAA